MPTILVVDDSAVHARLAGGLLARISGCTVEYAENGVQALARVEQRRPDLILTDLVMPEMDGLDLVRAVVARYPLLPVILMTGQGSEEIAIEALRQGAASYVPKSALTQLLVDTVERIYDLVGEKRTAARMLDSLERHELVFHLENDPALVSPLVQYLRATLEEVNLCDAQNTVRVSVALEEALRNALYQGNLEFTTVPVNGAPHRLDELATRQRTAPYCDRRLHVHARISRSEATFVIRDEGRGFDWTAVSPTATASFEKAVGRGLLLMQTFMDEVRYNESGNEVTLVKRRTS